MSPSYSSRHVLTNQKSRLILIFWYFKYKVQCSTLYISRVSGLTLTNRRLFSNDLKNSFWQTHITKSDVMIWLFLFLDISNKERCSRGASAFECKVANLCTYAKNFERCLEFHCKYSVIIEILPILESLRGLECSKKSGKIVP